MRDSHVFRARILKMPSRVSTSWKNRYVETAWIGDCHLYQAFFWARFWRCALVMVSVEGPLRSLNITGANFDLLSDLLACFLRV